jgi:ABC-type antimicrobial peptide transport system permease subunit
VLRDAFMLTLCGIAIGVPLALASARAIRSLLFAVQATDVPIFALIVVVILAVTAVAGYIPARRAASIDPATALRHE